MSSLNPTELRAAFGSFMTGVTIVTTRTSGGEPVGFTANSFSSVSLDPPLLLVCPGRFLNCFEAFASCQHFAVSVLAEGQEEISNTFAGYRGDRFAKVSSYLDLHNIPAIENAAAVFSCKTAQVIPAGDHVILLGEVRDFANSERAGLGYAAGSYFSLGLERAADASPRAGLTPVAGAIIELEGKVLLIRRPGGFEIPEVRLDRRSHAREALARYVTEALGEVSLEQAYSIFDDAPRGLHYTYFRARTAQNIDIPGGQFVPIEDLPALNFATPAHSSMMARFAVEYQTQDFGLYIGDDASGEIYK